MSEDERMDEIIRQAASDYNRAPAVPREEMWAAIRTTLDAPAPRLHVIAGGGAAGNSTTRRFAPRFAWMGIAAAAVLLVATGVGIGRYTSRPAVATLNQKPVGVYAAGQLPGSVAPGEAIGSGTTMGSEETTSHAAPRRSSEEIRKNPIITSIRKPAPVNPTLVAMQPNANVYQVATTRHLADAEALLTTFSLESRDAAMNKNFADWARGLLSNTRLLLDSPAGDDPRRAKLLQDLELVLAQIVQLSPGAAATDRELIRGSIQEGQVITRLRTAIPAGDAREILER